MKQALHLTVWLLAFAGLALGQGVSVVYLKTVQVPVPGATAAYSLDPLHADASAFQGVVSITGKGPGAAKIMVVAADGVHTLNVTVLQPPPSYPAGFVAPETLAPYGEDGSYEFRYSSDPAQWQNNLDMVWRNGTRRTGLRVNNANLLTPGAESRISFPMVSYSYASPVRAFTLLDQEVDHSLLTVDNAVVRGLHYRQGGWQFHAGVVSQTSFREFLLTSDTEELSGVSRSFRVGGHGELIPSFYFFRMDSANSPGRGGPVGSLMYRYRSGDDLEYSLEVGGSRGFGAAGRLRYETYSNQLHAEFRFAPRDFAGLGINQMRGQMAHLDFSHLFNHRLSSNLMVTRQRFDLQNGASSMTTASGLLRLAVTRHWNLNGGLSASQFSQPVAGASSLSTVTVPLGVDFASAHFGAGFEYQQHTGASTLASGGREMRVNAQLGIGSVQLTGFAGRQTNTPTLQTALPVNSPLAAAVGTQAALANTPDAIAGGLHDNLILAGLGYANSVQLAVAPQRLQFGGSLGWISHGSGRDQFSYNFLADRDRLPGGNTSYLSHAVVYTRQVTANNDVSVAFSLISLDSGGRGAYHPRFQVDARHRFNSLPGFFALGSHGLITGHVFQDDAATGLYRDGARGLAGIEMVLDGERRTRTTANGAYFFDHVPAGNHEIEAIPHLAAPYYFTTASSESVDINSRADFGIAFSAGQFFGFVRNDAELPIGGVTVRLRAGNSEIVSQTGDDGRFDRRSLPPGGYEISLDPASLPAGYWLPGLKSALDAVSAGNATQQDFMVKAIRSLGGRVLAYDVAAGQEVAVAGVVVTLHELDCAVVTDAKGFYRFRELPAGTYTVSVVYNGVEHTVPVTLGAGPIMVRDANVNVGVK